LEDDQGHEEHGDFHSNNGDLWDDGGAITEGKEFDLSDISKASLQFRTDMENMKLSSQVEISKIEEDTVEKLLEQQNANNRLKGESHTSSVITERVSVEKVTEEIHLPGLSQTTTTTTTKSSISSQLEIGGGSIEKSAHQTGNSGSSFLKSVLGENVFNLQSSAIPSAAAPLIAPAFGVNSFFQPEPLLYTAPPAPPAEPEWFYTDPQKQVQGPFSQENMRLWNEAGYFGKDLPIKLRQWVEFHVFREVFPDSRLAFYTVPQEPMRPIHNNPLSFLLPLNTTSNNLLSTENLNRRANPIDFAHGSLSSLPQEKPSLILGNEIKTHSDNRHLSRQSMDNANVFGSLQAPVQQHAHAHQGPISAAASNVNSAVASAAPAESNRHTEHRKNQATPEQIQQPQAQPAATTSNQQNQKLSVEKSDYAKQILGINKKADAVGHQAEIHHHKRESEAQPLESTATEDPHHHHHAPKENKQHAVDKNKQGGWKNEAPVAPKPVSFLDIQQEAEEEQKYNVKDKSPSQTSLPSPAQPTGAMSVQLKSLLGLKPGVGGVPSPAAAGPSSQGKPSKTAWSAPATESPSVPLKDIMKEEITHQLRKKDDPVTQEKVRGNTWAAKIGNIQGTLSPSAPSPVVSSPAVAVAHPKTSVVSQTNNVGTEKPQGSTAAVGRIQKSNEKSDFGGKRMSKDLAEWCATQLKAIKGIDDLTLMEFCMSLNSASEIRETLASYLGSSPQVLFISSS
jgi:hypothetical protein